MPRALSESELQEELKKRRNKKLMIRINHKCRTNEKAIKTVEEKLEIKVDWNTVGRSEQGTISLKFKNMEEKKNIVTKKWKLKGTEIYIDDEMTEREREKKNKNKNSAEKEKPSKVMCWNIAGIKEYSELNKLVENYDVVSLIETWVEEKDKEKVIKNLSSELKWWCKPAERKESCTRGRASSGHLIGVKKVYEKDWEIKEWKFGFTIRNDCRSELIVTVYNNVGIKKIKNVMKKYECEYENIIVIGDMNARIGECMVPGLSEDNNKKRKSKDKVINAEGKKLLKLCDDLGLKILNGATMGDRAGEMTFIGGKNEDCCSVLDLALQLDRGDEVNIMEFRVLKRIESDHLPIHIITRRNSVGVIEKDKKSVNIKKG
ncbi:Protein of unknown function [Cotesia congregata]|uniref:Endonuclease/exonuclease/phosphatase domain-containing protein n=1 Tax=Cotesia congregata TaxID=51543 RepID=A0A8J2MTX4_COTCN|nr:Protein of unknown function [Cotesia congregata]